MEKPKQASGIRLGVGLLRVSTDRQFAEGESIESKQRDFNNRSYLMWADSMM